jgi:hypothetical protein
MAKPQGESIPKTRGLTWSSSLIWAHILRMFTLYQKGYALFALYLASDKNLIQNDQVIQAFVKKSTYSRV